MPMNNRLLVPRQRGWSFQDSDARAYAMAVYAADGATLEPLVGKAIDDLVIGLKADGVWTSIGAACLLSGPRTLAGALVPLRGPAPTNTGFSAADYSRTMGLAGDGSGKRLSSNYNNNTPSQNDFSVSVWKTSTLLNDSALIGAGGVVGGASFFGALGPTGNGYYLNRYVGPVVSVIANVAEDLGFCGMNRSSGTEFVYRRNGTNTTVARNSATPLNATIDVFATSSISTPANVRLAWYHAGSSLDMAALEARLSTYLAAVNAAISGAPIVSNVDAQDWINRVYYNGGAVSATEAGAVNTFCNAIDAAGIRDRFLRLNPLMGGLLGSLVPLYRGPAFGSVVYGNATDTNANFVSGDYSLAGGLQSGVGSKRLSCGANLMSNATQANFHMMVDGDDFDVGSAAANVSMGHTNGGFTNRSFFQTTTASVADMRFASSGGVAATPSPANINAGMMLATGVSATDLRFYLDGSQSGSTVATNRGSAALEATDVPIFCLNQGAASYTAHCYCRAKAYSMGFGMTAAQVAAFRAALVAMYATIGRT